MEPWPWDDEGLPTQSAPLPDLSPIHGPSNATRLARPQDPRQLGSDHFRFISPSSLSSTTFVSGVDNPGHILRRSFMSQSPWGHHALPGSRQSTNVRGQPSASYHSTRPPVGATSATTPMDQPTDPTGARATKFRFKSSRRPDNDAHEEREPKPRHRSSNRPDTDPFTHKPDLSARAAFRESLFDARADAEGAAYWEAIYGQPIHTYDRPTRYNPATSAHEPVSDDEYAAHVRQCMWERTHAGALEDMRRRKEQHEARVHEARVRRARRVEEARLRREMEAALRRGEARRRERAHEDGFARYTAAWEAWDGTQDTIPWPTGSGTRQGVSDRAVRSFFTNGLGVGHGPDEFAAKLKEQRVRWHPDKMQQKLGGKDQVTKGVMADITMIFQVVDTLYHDFLKASKRE